MFDQSQILDNSEDINYKVMSLVRKMTTFPYSLTAVKVRIIVLVSFVRNIVSQKSIIKLALVFTVKYIAMEDAVDFALNNNNNHNFLIFSNAFNIVLSLALMKTNIRINSYIFNVKKKFNKFNRKNLNNFIKFYWISYKRIFGLRS